MYSLDELTSTVQTLLDQIHEEMYEKAFKYLLEHTTTVHTYDELKDVVENKGGYAKMMWCGEEECENIIKADTAATSRCMPFDQTPFGDVCPICGKKAKKVVLFAKAY
jgi:prolyl-tRNA synthetase